MLFFCLFFIVLLASNYFALRSIWIIISSCIIISFLFSFPFLFRLRISIPYQFRLLFPTYVSNRRVSSAASCFVYKQSIWKWSSSGPGRVVIAPAASFAAMLTEWKRQKWHPRRRNLFSVASVSDLTLANRVLLYSQISFCHNEHERINTGVNYIRRAVHQTRRAFHSAQSR